MSSSPLPVAPGLEGRLLGGRYRLERILGEGTFGRVYRAEDLRLERPVAVKVIKPWWAYEHEWVERFEREARLLARVSDPGIVHVYDIGEDGGVLFYVAELVEGESLAERLRRGALPPPEAAQIAAQLLRALGHAHARRIIHRDVKPANVLLARDGRVKVGDFGLARLAEGSTAASGGAVMGTPAYMAPEQARGAPPTPSSDLYSVAVVLYAMLAGRPPFGGRSAVEIAVRHLQDAPPPLPASVPAELAAILTRGLAKAPEDRFATAEEMAEALERALPRQAAGGGTDPSGASDFLGRGDRKTQTRPFSGPRRAGRTPAREGRPTDRASSATLPAPPRWPRRNVDLRLRRETVLSVLAVLVLLAAMALAALLLRPAASVRVPRLTGLDQAAARRGLRRAGLKGSFAHRASPTPAGRVIAQVPAAGRDAAQGSRVRVLLSDGPPPVAVPRITGETLSGARSVLSSLGLSVHVHWLPNPGGTPGQVTAQQPAGGGYVPAHGRVTISALETPAWHTVTTAAGQGSGASRAFTITARSWRVTTQLDFVGTCTLILFCDGPTINLLDARTGATLDSFSPGAGTHTTVESGPGRFRLSVSPGGDTARWALRVADRY